MSIPEVIEQLKEKSEINPHKGMAGTEVIDGEICLIVTDKRIKQIAEMMLFK